ncbi:MAG: plastocyanin/azurin family copper-binding protein [Thermohalobaculum sp.]|nr:plastocyanin/azurin family copper-binding protein [Thermohalobaculum sp.]
MRLPTFAATALLAGLALPGIALAQMDDATARRCAEAEAKYADLIGHPPAAEPVTVVIMYKYSFCPPQLGVAAGTTVRWVNLDRAGHNVWFRAAGEPEPERIYRTESVETTFATPGEHPYVCGPHWESHAMMGSVTVTP